MTNPRASRLVALMLAPLLLLAACGPSAHERAVQTTFAALNASRDIWLVWDERQFQEIVDTAKTYEGGLAAIEAYRVRQEKFRLLFAAAYAALAVATSDPGMGALLEAAAAAKKVYEAVKALTTKQTP